MSFKYQGQSWNRQTLEIGSKSENTYFSDDLSEYARKLDMRNIRTYDQFKHLIVVAGDGVTAIDIKTNKIVGSVKETAVRDIHSVNFCVKQNNVLLRVSGSKPDFSKSKKDIFDVTILFKITEYEKTIDEFIRNNQFVLKKKKQNEDGFQWENENFKQRKEELKFNQMEKKIIELRKNNEILNMKLELANASISKKNEDFNKIMKKCNKIVNEYVEENSSGLNKKETNYVKKYAQKVIEYCAKHVDENE
jgi:hypothetical protein